MGFVSIKTYTHASFAHMDKEILQNNGLTAVIENENTIATDGLLQISVGNIQLSVMEKDVEAAKRLLSSENDVPLEGEVDSYVCPQCGSDRISEYAPYAWFALLPILFPLMFIRKMACHHCKHKWKRQ